MGNYTRTYNPQPAQRVGSTELKGEFAAIEAAFNTEASEAERTLRQTGGSAVNALPNAISRALKVLSFDADGHPRTTIAETDLAAAVTAAATATTQAGIATTQAGIATTQAGISTTGASTATTQAGIATAQAAAAAASYDSFDDRYLGPKSSDPTLDNDGAALLTGALYWNTAVPEMRVWTGSAWVDVLSTDSPALTGVPTAPTAAAGTNTTQIATTAHVFAERTNAATLTNKTLTSPVINTPTGIVKGNVGLGNVDNTSDANKPVSTATQTALNLKANLASPALTGNVTVTTNSTSPALTITQDGTGNALEVRDVTGDTTPFVVDANGYIVSGSSVAYNAGSVVGVMQSHSTNVAIGAPSGYLWSADTNGVIATMAKSRGAAIGTHTVVQSGDVLGQTRYYGSDGANFKQAANIAAEVDGTPGTNDMPGRLVFSTTADGASSPTEAFRISSARLITAMNSTGLGYGLGSGGMVTQATSKSTAVTLNKPSGNVVMHDAALAAGASVAFLLTNSAIAAPDTVTVAANNNGNYSIEVYAVVSGGCYIRITNRTAGSLSEAVVINFNVHKGSAT